MMDEELPILSSSPLLSSAPVETKPQDELDLPALKRVQKAIEDEIQSYKSITRLTVDEKELTVQQQLAVNKSIVAHLTQIQLLVETVILNIKEKYKT